MHQIPLTVDVAANDIGLTRQAIHHYINTGRLQIHRSGKIILILPGDWERFKADYNSGKLDGRSTR